MYKNIIYFKGLNQLRFIAALLVVLHHGEGIRKKNDLFSLEWLSFFKNGGNAVAFFFVLSGFLITYLLLKERKKENISIKEFYIKRVLRIWPLYFLLVIIGCILLPLTFQILNIQYLMPYSFSEVWYYFLFFTPCLVQYYFGSHLLQPLWSIGVEEIFYIIWAPIFKYLKKYLVYILFAIISIKLCLSIFCEFEIINLPLLRYIIKVHEFELMAIGALGALFVYNSKKKISDYQIFNKAFQIILYGILLIFLFFNQNINLNIWTSIFRHSWSSLILGCLYLYLIISISLSEKSIVKLNNKFLSYLGEISYGIYMYHMLIIFAVIQFLKDILSTTSDTLSTIIFYGIVLISTIIVSAISKHFFENFFLIKIRNKIIKQ